MIPKKLAQASAAAQLRWIRRNGRKFMDRELRERVAALLREIEWTSYVTTEPGTTTNCLGCGAWIGDVPRVHGPDCELAAVLRELTETCKS